MESLSSKSVTIWRLRATAIATIGVFLSGGICVFDFFVGVTVALLLVFIYIISVTWYFPMLYNRYHYNIGTNSITLRKGIILKRNIIIECKKIQYREIRQTPLQKLFKTAALKIYTCGTYVIISQIDLSDAQKYLGKAG